MNWDRAVRFGVCTDDEADLFRDCFERDDDGVWRIDVAGLNDAQLIRLSRVVKWATSSGTT